MPHLEEAAADWHALREEHVAVDLGGFPARLEEAIGAEPVARFAQRAGLRDTLVRKYLSGVEPGLSKAAALATAAGRSLDWLATGQSAAAEDDAGDGQAIQLGRLQPGGVEPPLRRRWPLRDVIALRDDLVARIAGPRADPSQLGWLEVVGDSMAPTLNHGDFAVVRTGGDTVLHHRHVYVIDWQTPGRPWSILRAVWQPDGRLRLESDRVEARADDPQPLDSEGLAKLAIVGEVAWRAGSL